MMRVKNFKINAELDDALVDYVVENRLSDGFVLKLALYEHMMKIKPDLKLAKPVMISRRGAKNKVATEKQ